MADMIGLDFETYAWTSLPDHGLDRYVNCPTFVPLLASVTWRDSYGGYNYERLDLVQRRAEDLHKLEGYVNSQLKIVAHNAPFERAVLKRIGFDVPADRFIDSAVVARGAGAGSRLEAAAPQLLGIDKVEEGRDLMRLFSIPGKYQDANDTTSFVADVVRDHPDEWDRYGHYCDVDSELGLGIVEQKLGLLPDLELEFQAVTMRMNAEGWPVDVALVEEMQRRYLENQEAALAEFRVACNAADLNVASLKQLREWCYERGVRASSFDEKHVDQLLARVGAKLDDMLPGDPKWQGYWEVHQLLLTKQVLGGSSLKKLATILDTVSEDGRLRDQYLHVGAGQSWRTTGRSVQMQNLKRLGSKVADVEDLFDEATDWSNEELAENLRQAFTASDPDGELLVGDFKSVESRGLAWLACATMKVEAFRQGLDIYKVGASRQYGVTYDQVTDQQRQFGKVGELSCGYQAGAGAVKDFAEKMGVVMSEEEAGQLVSDWRSANPEIEQFWWQLDEALRMVVTGKLGSSATVALPDGFSLRLVAIDSPESLREQHPGVVTVELRVYDSHGHTFLVRLFHGCYLRGRDVCYYKPSSLKTGDLWSGHYMHPKTKQLVFHKLYGGKLAGILTQSFCRELFFRCLTSVQQWVDQYPQLTLIGQFHDEIVVDWLPGSVPLPAAVAHLEVLMSDPGVAVSFPLGASVKHAYRYIK